MAYLVTPYNSLTGAEAPSMISFREKTDDAIADVKERSALSKYKNWYFTHVKYIKEKSIKKSYKDLDQD